MSHGVQQGGRIAWSLTHKAEGEGGGVASDDVDLLVVAEDGNTFLRPWTSPMSYSYGDGLAT
jgi:hypothetical protein